MPILHAIVLGLVQGLSEFLPISSSGHLLLVPWLFGWDDFDDESTEKAFDVALHIGTLIAAVAYFRHDLVRYVAGWRRGRRATVGEPVSTDGRVAWLLLLSTVPAAVVGAVFEDSDRRAPRDADDHRHLADRRRPPAGRGRPHDRATARSRGTGAATPSSSAPPRRWRSTRARRARGSRSPPAGFLGFDRDAAARISFLMMIPVTAGAVAFKMVGLAGDGIPEGLARADDRRHRHVRPCRAGSPCGGRCTLVRTHSFTPFVIYRVALGVVVLVVAGHRLALTGVTARCSRTPARPTAAAMATAGAASSGTATSTASSRPPTTTPVGGQHDAAAADGARRRRRRRRSGTGSATATAGQPSGISACGAGGRRDVGRDDASRRRRCAGGRRRRRRRVERGGGDHRRGQRPAPRSTRRACSPGASVAVATTTRRRVAPRAGGPRRRRRSPSPTGTRRRAARTSDGRPVEPRAAGEDAAQPGHDVHRGTSRSTAIGGCRCRRRYRRGPRQVDEDAAVSTACRRRERRRRGRLDAVGAGRVAATTTSSCRLLVADEPSDDELDEAAFDDDEPRLSVL